MTQHQETIETLETWLAAGKPEIPHPMIGVTIIHLDKWLNYHLEDETQEGQENYEDELARIRRHLGLDT